MHYTGLHSSEVLSLQEKYGFNEVTEKVTSGFIRFAKKLINPIPLMIEIALILSALSGRWEDFSIIFVLLAVNLGVEFWQEQKAFKALAELNKSLALRAQVVRDGVLKEIDARELVPGDIIKLTIGDIVPADSVLLENSFLDVDQSAITGESLSVEKTKDDEVPSGSVVQKGSQYAKVLATGIHTKIGKSAQLVAQAEQQEESHFQKAILKIGKFLIILSLALVIVTFILLLLRGDSLIETLRFALVLTIASIPVALPAVLSVTMAIGANTLAKRHAIVSNFKAIEELAGVDVLCIDKTGTLTKNSIEVYPPQIYGDFTEEEVIQYAILASEETHKTPIEKAIEAYADKKGYIIDASYSRNSFIPFNPTNKTTEVFFTHGQKEAQVIMGASQVIYNLTKAHPDTAKLKADTEHYAVDGFRTIALAYKVKGEQYVPVAVLPLMDPPREDSKEVIKEVKARGVSIKMLTGDNAAIAGFMAKLLSIGSSVMPASKLHAIRKKETTYAVGQVIEKTDVYAEVVPEDKFFIIKTLKKHNHIVAMTGDGVNDAPALKKADIGIAVSGATPAARAAADVVLLDSGLSIIKEAIDLARQTFHRMQAYATFRISETIRIVFFITLAVLFFDSSPLTSVMIIILALLNDIPVLAIAYDNAAVEKHPIRWKLKETLIVATVLGLTGLISSFGLLWYLHAAGYSLVIIQTIIFLKLDVAGHSTLYLTRTGKKHFWARPFPSLKFFIPAFSTRIIGTIFALSGFFMTAIDIKTVVYIWVYSTVWFLVNDQVKVYTYKVLERLSR